MEDVVGAVSPLDLAEPLVVRTVGCADGVLLREALDAAHRAGAARLAQRVETELGAAGARPRRVVLTGLESLTASERRIAELASQDLTNREIAQLLFITDRTVEGHLTSVFRKLRLDSHNELSAAPEEAAPVTT